MSYVHSFDVSDPSKTFDLAGYVLSSEAFSDIYGLISSFNFEFSAVNESTRTIEVKSQIVNQNGVKTAKGKLLIGFTK